MEHGYKPKYPVQTLEKSIDVLYCLKECTSLEGMSIAEINERLDLGKSAIHRILDTLYAYGFVEKTEKGTGYRLGWGLYDIAQSVPACHNLDERTYRKVLETLCNDYMETVNIGILNDGEVVIICKIEPDRRLRSTVSVGQREPLYATALGKHFLSTFSKEELRKYFESFPIEKLTERTIVTAEEMEVELQKVRKQGYSLDYMEFCDELICTAVPVYDYKNNMIAAISISVPEGRYTEEKGQEIVDGLKEAAFALSEYLGYQNR